MFNSSIVVCRQSRTTDRFTERMMSLEKTKAMREKKTPTPKGLTGKFSSVFSRFESSDDLNKGRKSASPVTTRSKSTGPPARRGSERSIDTAGSADAEMQKPAKTRGTETRSQSEEKTSKSSSLKRTDAVDKPAKTESRGKRVERSKTFDTGIPSRSPSGNKVIERMAKFGQSVDIPSNSQQTITTKNNDTERFERRTVDSKRQSKSSKSQPHFDVDIHISREPLEDSDQSQRDRQGTKTAAITVGRDKVKVKKLDKKAKSSSGGSDNREEYLNVWDTEVPVRDGKSKVIACDYPSSVIFVLCPTTHNLFL